MTDYYDRALQYVKADMALFVCSAMLKKDPNDGPWKDSKEYFEEIHNDAKGRWEEVAKGVFWEVLVKHVRKARDNAKPYVLDISDELLDEEQLLQLLHEWEQQWDEDIMRPVLGVA